MSTIPVIKYYYRPSLTLTREECQSLVSEFRRVAADSLHIDATELPNYQCIAVEDPVNALDDKVIVAAHSRVSGEMIAFTSAVLLRIPSLSEPVLHTGLTCIIPSARSMGLTKTLVEGLVGHYISAPERRNQTIWLSNLAAVVSSLGNFAMFMDEVHPSPRSPPPHSPSSTHAIIARTISESPQLRRAMYVTEGAYFDWEKWVFRGSGKGTVFEKSADGDCEVGRHRDNRMNAFYKEMMSPGGGDEVLQVGRFSMETVNRYRQKTKL